MRRTLDQLRHSTAFEHGVGRTPLLRLKWASELTKCEIFAKAEYANPGGSVKDRAGLCMIKDAEARGVLKRGERGIVVEGTAGNTGIGLAHAAHSLGYDTVICIANTQSEEKKNTLRWAGAHLVEVPAVPFRDPNNYVHVAERVAANLASNGVRTLYANQWDNPANMQAHIEGTGPEIVEQLAELGLKPDSFSCAVGTGGTLHGTSKYLRSQFGSGVTIGLTDPRGAALVKYFNEGVLQAEGSSITEGIGQSRITGNLKGFRPDVALEIPDSEMIETLHNLQRYEGLVLGGSSGINVAGAIRIAKMLGPGKVVCTILCDSGTRYAGKLFNQVFMRSKGLEVAEWLDQPKVEAKFRAVGLDEAVRKAIL